MEQPPLNSNTMAGTTGGTLLVVLLQVGQGELVKTMLLAAVGAAVSFTVSLFLKWLLRHFRQKG